MEYHGLIGLWNLVQVLVPAILLFFSVIWLVLKTYDWLAAGHRVTDAIIVAVWAKMKNKDISTFALDEFDLTIRKYLYEHPENYQIILDNVIEVSKLAKEKHLAQMKEQANKEDND